MMQFIAQYFPRSFAFRLTVTYCLIFTVIVSAGLTLLFYAMQNSMQNDVDSVLREHVESIEFLLDDDKDVLTWIEEKLGRELPLPSIIVNQFRFMKNADVLAMVIENGILPERLNLVLVNLSRENNDSIAMYNKNNLENATLNQWMEDRLATDSDTYFTFYNEDENQYTRIVQSRLQPDLILQLGISYTEYINNLRILQRVLFTVFFVFLVMGFIAGYYMAQKSMQGVNKVSNVLNTFAEGDFSVRVNVSNYGTEIENLGNHFNQMADRVHSAQAQMIRSEKMASLGQLVAGIAHEINNPMNFIKNGVSPIKEYLFGSLAVVKKIQDELDRLPDDVREEFLSIMEEYDLEFAAEDSPHLLKSFEDGSERISGIVRDLQEYARIDDSFDGEVNLIDTIETSLNLLGSPFEDKIRVEKQFTSLPAVEGSQGKINQVFMNLLTNAMDAIEHKGTIWLAITAEGDNAVVTIRDDGPGIPKDVQLKIFDPFFTTKPVGSGTGLGLSIAQTIIEQHKGSILVESEEGKGSMFTVSIPFKRNT